MFKHQHITMNFYENSWLCVKFTHEKRPHNHEFLRKFMVMC